MAGQSIDATFAAILKDCQAVAVEAVKNAAKKAQDDVRAQAQLYVRKYYASYKPKRYKRGEQLYTAITPVFEDHSTHKGISFKIGVEYDSSKLKRYSQYSSNSKFHQSGSPWRSVTDHSKFSPDNGIVEPEWIMGNFLEGIHPITQFDPSKENPYVYEPKQDSVSTNTLMVDFFDNTLPDRIDQYVKDSLWDAITNRLQGR